MFEKQQEFHVAVYFKCGVVPLGVYSESYAKFVAEKAEEDNKMNPLFEKVVVY